MSGAKGGGWKRSHGRIEAPAVGESRRQQLLPETYSNRASPRPGAVNQRELDDSRQLGTRGPGYLTRIHLTPTPCRARSRMVRDLIQGPHFSPLRFFIDIV